MIPAWLDLRLIAAFVLGCVVTAPLSYCKGKSDAVAANAAKIESASAKVIVAASKAESAATMAEMARTVHTEQEAKELKEIINEQGTSDSVGPSTSAILDRLRARKR